MIPTGPRAPTTDACGCVRYADGSVAPCWNHGRHIPGHEAYRAGLWEVWGWEPTVTKEGA